VLRPTFPSESPVSGTKAKGVVSLGNNPVQERAEITDLLRSGDRRPRFTPREEC